MSLHLLVQPHLCLLYMAYCYIYPGPFAFCFRWIPPAMTLAGSSHQTAAQRGGEAKDKDKPLSDMQRDR